jgi:ribonuclease E
MSSPRKMFINAADPEEFRVCIVAEGQLDEFALETSAREQTKANIYKAVVVNIEPSLQAAFVNYGGERHGFLPLSEVHPDYYQEQVQGKTKAKIQRVLRKGQEIIVQVYKEETGTKGAYLSTYISLPGRNLVLLPRQAHLGISRKIEKEDERLRLKDLAQKIGLPPEMGLIIRTAGEQAKTRDLAKDLQFLLKQWEELNQTTAEQKVPCLLYRDLDMISRTVRDYLTTDINTILVDSPDVFQQLRGWLRMAAPRQLHALKLYKDKLPILTRYQLDEQLDRIYAERVPLKSGGSIVINPTEALVSIDVNSGRCTGQKELEETALKTNLEAADEVARQLRLRDLGGLVVIDFIDMKDKKHQKEVEAVLKQSLKKDKARVTVGHLSKFGLLELSRQRLRPTAEASAYTPCPTCQGRGRLKTVPVLSLSLLRQISTQVVQNQLQEVRAVVPVEVSNFLLNQKRKEILALEEQYNLRIVLTATAGLNPDEIQLEFVKREAEEAKREVKPAPQREARPQARPAAPHQPQPEAQSERTVEAQSEAQPEATPEAKPEARGTRRGTRRGPRRGPRRPREAKVEATPEVQPETPAEVEAQPEAKSEARKRRAPRRGPRRPPKQAPKEGTPGEPTESQSPPKSEPNVERESAAPAAPDHSE